jgi:putative sterol carrier protein
MASFEEYAARFKELFEKAKEKMPDIATWNKVYQLVVSGVGEFYIEISGGQLKVEKGRHPNPIATLQTDEETLSKILSGELDAMRAFMTRKLTITGNVIDTVNLKRIIDLGLGKE